jgi:hypothetical protein
MKATIVQTARNIALIEARTCPYYSPAPEWLDEAADLILSGQLERAVEKLDDARMVTHGGSGHVLSHKAKSRIDESQMWLQQDSEFKQAVSLFLRLAGKIILGFIILVFVIVFMSS